MKPRSIKTLFALCIVLAVLRVACCSAQEIQQIRLTDSYIVEPNMILENLWLDARFIGSKPAVVFRGSFGMLNNARLVNVNIRCNGNAGVLMQSAKGVPLSFNDIDVSVFNAAIALEMDSSSGGWINANNIEINAYNCGRFLDMRSRKGGGMTGNFIRYQLQPKKSDTGRGIFLKTGRGIFCDGRRNTFEGVAWDWQHTPIGVDVVHFGKYSRHNIVRNPVFKDAEHVENGRVRLTDEGKSNRIE